MAKVTSNLLTIVKAIGQREISVNELSVELKKTTNSIRATVSVKDYKDFFIINNTNIVEGKIVKLYKLSPTGLDLLTNDKKEEE